MIVVALFASLSPAAEGERWLKVTAPEFTVITSLREKDALMRAGEFSQFVGALQSFIRVDPKRLPRLTMVLFARERDFERFRPLTSEGTVMDVAGFFSRRPSWAVAGMAGARMSAETRATIFHEGTHWFLSGFELPNPVWLEEGVAEVFSTFAIEGKNTSWGRAIEPHVEMLRMMPQLPLEQLLFVSQDGLHGGDDDASLRAGMVYAQSWAFVHYLIFGQHSVPKGSLMNYVRGLRSMHPDVAFKEAFGGSYSEVGHKLAEYLRSGRYYVAKQPLLPLPNLKTEPATAAEVEEALARLRMGARRHGEARENVSRLIAATPDQPRGYELLGELEEESGNSEAAQTAFRKAIERDSSDFRPYFEFARSEHERAGEAGLTPEHARGIANAYERAINYNPRYVESFQGLAGLMALVPPGNTEDVKFLTLGQRLFPDDGMIRLGLAAISKRDGDEARARALLQEVLESPHQPAHVMGYARRIEASWMQRDVFGRIEELVKEKKFAEAVAFIDAQLEAGVDLPTRQRLQRRREELSVSVLLDEARAASNERRWEDALAKYDAVLASNASVFLKTQVRRQVENLQKRVKKN